MSFLFSFRRRATIAECALVMGAALALVLGYTWVHFNILAATPADWAWHRAHSQDLITIFHLAMIALAWPLGAVSVNRLHDSGLPGRPAAWILLPWLVFWTYPLLQMAAGDHTVQLSSLLMFAGWLTFAVKGGTRPGVGPNAWGPGRAAAGGWEETVTAATAATATTVPAPAAVPAARMSPAPMTAAPQPVRKAPARAAMAAAATPSFGRRR